MRGRLVARVAVLWAVFAAGCDGCAPERESSLFDAGYEADSGVRAGAGGLGGLGGIAAAGSGGTGSGADDYRVAIRASKRVLCPGECTELSAQAMNGHAPYEYAWSGGIGAGAGPHTVCPQSTATYTVTARDTAIEGEFARPSRFAEATIGIVVDESDARGCTEIDGGPGPDPNGSTELCTIEIAYEEPGELAIADTVEDASTFATDADGNIYVAGSFAGRIDFGEGFVDSDQQDGFVAKYDASCALVWSRTFGEPGAQLELKAMGVAQSGTVVVGGSVTGTMELDGHVLAAPVQQLALVSVSGDDGSVEWVAGYDAPGPAGLIRDLAVDGAGDIVFTSYASAPLSIAGVSVSAAEGALELLAKVSANGEYRFAYDIVGTDLELRVAVHDSGTIAIASRSYGASLGFGLAELPLGGDDESHRYVAVLEADGTPRWGRALDLDLLPTNSYWPISTVAFDGEGNLFVEHGNILTDELDPERLSKYDPRGTLLWTEEIPLGVGVLVTRDGRIAADSLGNVVHTSLAADPDDAASIDVIVRKLAPDGALIWRHVLDHELADTAFDVAIAPDDSIWVGHGRFDASDGIIRLTKLAPLP